MKDFFEQDLAVGDNVVFIESGYRQYRKGTITKISDVKCTIALGKIDIFGKDVTALRYGCDIIKQPVTQ